MLAKFRSAKGSSVLFTLMIGLTISIAGVAFWQMGSSNQSQTAAEESEQQAFYLAKSGVELAIGLIRNNGINYLLGEDGLPLPLVQYFAIINQEGIVLSAEEEDYPNYNVHFTIERFLQANQNDHFEIHSTGRVLSAGANGSEVAADAIGFTITLADLRNSGPFVGAGPGGMPPFDMIFAVDDGKNALDLGTGNSEIVGNAGTNAIAPDSVKFQGNSMVTGHLYIGPEGTADTVDYGKGNSHKTHVGGEIRNLASNRVYTLPKFPEFPEFESSLGSLDKGNNKNQTISASGWYDSISLGNGTLTINTGNEEIVLRIRSLDMKNLDIIGDGSVVLYIEEFFDIKNSKNVNSDGRWQDLSIYYAGDEDVEWSGNGTFVGSIFVQTANMKIGGNNDLIGHVISGGDEVEIHGNASATGTSRVVYAPKATVHLKGNTEITGVVIAKRIAFDGNSTIIYRNIDDYTFLEDLDWGEGGFVNWQETGRWRRVQ